MAWTEKAGPRRRKENTCNVTRKWARAGQVRTVTSLYILRACHLVNTKCWWWKLAMVWVILYQVMKCGCPVYQEFTQSLHRVVRAPLGGMRGTGSLRLLRWALSSVECTAESLNCSYSSLDFVMGEGRGLWEEANNYVFIEWIYAILGTNLTLYRILT